MKKIIFSLFLVAFSLNAWAQKDKYTKQVAEKTCDCLSKKLIAVKDASVDLKDITDCLGTGGFGEFYKEVAKEHNIDITGGLNEQTASLIGEKIGIKLVEIDCAPYKTFIYKYMDIDKDGKKADKPIEKPSTKTTYFTDHFTFQRIENTDSFAMLIAKDDKGREINLRVQKHSNLQVTP
jgi:hypothetical protein